ncbi:hypothetical protein HS125_19505 [bacterium]|nr:hypothetical protein [bacterium]
MLPIQIDNDGDWNPDRDDHNGNGRPDGDWASGPESDTFNPLFSSDGIDNDRDGRVDEPGEGNGQDDDRDGLIDDDGDINGDGNVGYDPEWGVNEDPWGDANGDGYPGVQGIDDDGDGGTDFNDPEVKRALDAIALLGWANDGIDNDWDGLTDEFGEPYLAAWDDDEDGRFDEDPPEYPYLVNLVDYIDQPVGNFDPPTIARLYGYSGRHVSYPFQRFAAFLGTTPDQLPIPLTSPADGGLPPMREGDTSGIPYLNLNHVGVYTGLEGVRLNEIMSAPVIHLEAENADTFEDSRDFTEGAADDTLPTGTQYWYDTSWSRETTERSLAGGALRITPYKRELYDANAPRAVNRAYYRVINDPYKKPASEPPSPSDRPNPQPERARWTWENVPEGVYDVVITTGPITYDPFTTAVATELQKAIKINDTDVLALGGWNRTVRGADFNAFTVDNVNLTGGKLEIDIEIPADLGNKGKHGTGAWGEHDLQDFSFDSVDLFAKDMQYLELINLSRLPVDVSGWQVWVTGQATNKYVIGPNAVIPPFDPNNPTDFRNYLLIVPDRTKLSVLEAFYNTTINVAVNEAVSESGLRMAFSELFLTNPVAVGAGKFSGERLDISPREGIVQLVGPVAGTGVNLVPVDRMKYFTSRLNALKPTGRLGFTAQERRDPGELRFNTSVEQAAGRRVSYVSPETPTMRFYALQADRPAGTNLDRMRFLGGRATDSQDAVLGRRLGMYFAPTHVSDNIRIGFFWKGSARLATLMSPDAVYQVRVFGVLNRPVGQVVIPDAPGTDLNWHLLSPLQDDAAQDLYVNPVDRLTRAQMHHGNVVFYWYPRQQGDLTLELVCDGAARDLAGRIIPDDEEPGFYFDYVEVTRVGDFDTGDRKYLYRTGTPGAPNPFYLPDFDPFTGELWSSPSQPYSATATHNFGLDRDAKTQRYVPVKNGGLASPGYLVNVHNGKPFGRFGLTDLSPNFAFLTGSRTEGRMIPGQINLNTAPLPVLSALPWAPPTLPAAERADWNWIVARHVLLGRRLVGHDGVFGAFDSDGDGRFDPQPQSAYRERGSDDGPYETVADLLPVLFSQELYDELSARFPGQVDKADLTMSFARVCNLATTRSLVFSVISRGQIVDLSPDRDEMVLSQKVMESIFLRFAQ